MQFTSAEEIDAPIETVFAEITDFAAFERAAQRRGAKLRRTDTLSVPGVGMGWHASFHLRERRREVDLALVAYEPPHGITLDVASPAIAGRMRVDLSALSPAHTRLSVDLTVEPKGMAGRVMLQPVKLMRGNLTRRFRLRVAGFAADVAERFRNRA